MVFRYGIALDTTGVIAAFNRADRDICGFHAHFRTITVHAVEQMPFIATISIRGHKHAAATERVKGPDTVVVLITEAIHPGENMGLQRCLPRNITKVRRPEIKTLFVRYR